MGRLVLPVLGSVLLAIGAAAQEAPVVVEFSLSNPGARAMGFGGAFTALADDATAAFANPAGLVQLTRPEVSAEGRLWSYGTPFTLGGRYDGSQPTGILLDDTSGLRTAESSQDLAGLSFLSFVYPLQEWSFAFYLHQAASFEFQGETQGFFGEARPPSLGTRGWVLGRTVDVRSSITVDVVSYGFSVAHRVGEDVSLGLGVSYLDAKFTSRSEIYLPTEQTLPEGLFGRNSYEPAALADSGRLSIDDSDWTLNLGILWRVSQQWRLGGFFRKGSRFRIEARSVSGPAIPELPPGTLLYTRGSPIGLPDVFGLGVAYRSKDGALTVAGEWDRVRYSILLDSLEPDAFETSEFALDDADELRGGLEYAFIDRVPVVALRLGIWLDPDHRTRAVGEDPFIRANFQAGSDELHFTGGLGLAIRGLQVDLGLDLSDVVKTVSLSTVLSF